MEPPIEHHQPAAPRRATSLVIVNTGDGKGKSTAAFGILMRSLARGWNVAVVQFVKSGTWRVGEEALSRQLGADWWTIGEGFSWDSEDLSQDQAVAAAAWRHAGEVIAAGQHQLVILDEVTYPINWGWIGIDDAVATVTGRPAHVNLVLTGRDAPAAVVEVADTVTEMRNVKHAYDQGIRARRGIDY